MFAVDRETTNNRKSAHNSVQSHVSNVLNEVLDGDSSDSEYPEPPETEAEKERRLK
jgi:hypothetical protein